MSEAYAIIEKNIIKLSKQRNFEIELNKDTTLVGADFPFDSLDLATLVVEMQNTLNKNPFESGFVDFITVGDLVKLFDVNENI